jgi:hypothetical protein
MSEWDQIRGKNKNPKKQPLWISLKSSFITCKIFESYLLHMHARNLPHYQRKDSRGDRNQSVRVLTLKEIAQKGVCDKEYP